MTIRLFLRYDGTELNGWQMQNIDGKENPDVKTVQGILNRALRTLLADEKICVVGCSRTDAGVHACEYCASFDVEKSIVPPEKIAAAIGHLLPANVVVYKSEIAPDGFNARFDIKSKTYKYYFYLGDFADPMRDRHAWFVKCGTPLDLKAMNKAATYLVGTHNFDAFCADLVHAKTTLRTINECFVEEISPMFYALTVNGDGFLYNMVRIITGTLLYVGQQKINPEEIPGIIDSKCRSKAGITAPPEGLHLFKVYY